MKSLRVFLSRQLAMVVLSFLLGSFLTFAHQQNLFNQQTQQIKSLVSDSRNLFNAQHALTTSCFEAYNILTQCTLENPGKCDPNEVVSQIKEQTLVRDEAINYIDKTSKDIESTIKKNNW